MFAWRRKKAPSPPVTTGNPGHGHTVKTAFSNAQHTWQESADLLEILAATLTDAGHSVARREKELEMDSGLRLYPQFVALQPRHPSGVQTTSTIQVSHPMFPPSGLFEYQHSAGNDLRESFAGGFQNWADLDLPVFLDALQEEPQSCMCMAMTFPEDSARAKPLHRRVVLGPAAHMVNAPSSETAEEHPFCPCCLLTNSFEAFKELLSSEALYGIRLFAMRGEDGQIQADCRVNGEDFPQGADALIQYASSWPRRGFEFRKQYLIMQTQPTQETS